MCYQNLCRLCFSFNRDDLTDLICNNDVLAKVRAITSLEIPVTKDLPCEICKACHAKVLDYYQFNLTVHKNEMQLLNNLENVKGTLIAFYSSLKEGVKTEDMTVKLEIPDEESLDKTRDVPVFKNGFIKTEGVSIEENTCNYSSEDDICLSAIKSKSEEKEKLAEAEQWKCLTCGNLYTARIKLLKHYKIDHDASNNTKILDNFTKTVKENGEEYCCIVCKKTYIKKRDIKRHMISHVEARPYNCSMCGRKYKTAADIVRHGRAHRHKLLACSEGCGFSTAYRGALINHERLHRPHYKFTCEHCGKGFQVRSWFLQHQNLHTGAKPYVCGDCGKGFHMDRYLAVHRNKMHPGSLTAERHYCVHCDFRCASRVALTQHLKEHGMAASFLCDICGKSLATAENLKYHRRTHLDEKPHSCSTCGKSFAKKFNLTLHERIHTGEKPHVCTKCGKGFAQRGTLVVHTRYHSGSRPYQCNKCPKAFVSNHQLTTHQKLHA